MRCRVGDCLAESGRGPKQGQAFRLPPPKTADAPDDTPSSRTGIMDRFSSKLQWPHGRCILRWRMGQGPFKRESGSPPVDSVTLLTTPACLHIVR